MSRLKCKKCGKVFEKKLIVTVLTLHIGPLHYVKCPACGKNSWFNLYTSVNEPVTWPTQEAMQASVEPKLTEEELEKKRIEDSKYERS